MEDYKKYSLEQLENWIHDTLSAGEATPEEVYNTIRSVVEEQYYHHKHHTSQAYELLALLNGNGKDHYQYNIDPKGNQVPVDTLLTCDKDDPSPECKGAWNSFWQSDGVEYDLREAEYYNNGNPKTYYEMIADGYEMTADGFWIRIPPDDKVVKWQLPVEVDGLSGECYVTLPDDLLDVANLKEGDTVEWVDNGDGSYTMRKVK